MRVMEIAYKTIDSLFGIHRRQEDFVACGLLATGFLSVVAMNIALYRGLKSPLGPLSHSGD